MGGEQPDTRKATSKIILTILSGVATWDEVDFDHAIWIIPGSRMKAGKEHRVPLSAATLDLLRSVAMLRAAGDRVFPSPYERHQPMIDRALSYPLERMGRGDLTVHGFRSTSATGRRRRRAIRTTSSSRRWLTRSATRSRRPPGAVICSRSGSHS
jgi:integrase